ncbi:hypothetical protein H4S02_005467 [Coemansia sp. RSA 2611]|nr:hypothetical protein H4S02_005467 [Coemansia sp. RSA 2611]
MSEGPKRFSLSDYQSKRGPAKPAETSAPNELKSELEELHMLLGTGTDIGGLVNGSDEPDILRTPGASPDNCGGAGNMDEENEEGEDVEASERERSNRHRRSEKPQHLSPVALSFPLAVSAQVKCTFSVAVAVTVAEPFSP